MLKDNRKKEGNQAAKNAEKAQNTGSITVEACIVVPIMVLALVICGYLSTVIYQKAFLYNSAFTASQNLKTSDFELFKGSVLKPVSSDILRSTNKTIFSSQNIAQIENKYKLPWGGYVVIAAAAQQVHCDCSSFIRNIDFVEEIVKDLSGAAGDTKTAANKISEMVEAAEEKVAEYGSE